MELIGKILTAQMKVDEDIIISYEIQNERVIINTEKGGTIRTDLTLDSLLNAYDMFIEEEVDPPYEYNISSKSLVIKIGIESYRYLINYYSMPSYAECAFNTLIGSFTNYLDSTLINELSKVITPPKYKFIPNLS